MVVVFGNKVLVFRRYKRSVFRCSSNGSFGRLRNLLSRKSLRFTGIAELGFVATLLGNVLGGTLTAGAELGTELGFVAALLGIVLGGTPMAGTELGTELGFVAAPLGNVLGDTPTFNTGDLELGTALGFVAA